MPVLHTAQAWLTESTLLLEARPSTTRITSKYTISPLPGAQHSKTKTKSKTRRLADPAAPRATLMLKTFDPASGTTLKYQTDKAAEVSRLIQILGRLARPMAGLEIEDEVKEEVKAEGEEKDGLPVAVEGKGPSEKTGGQGGQQQAGKGKGKKKGKK